MEFFILGPLEVRARDGPVALGGVKPRAVLAVLILNANQPVSAERLAVALWGEDAPGGATRTVHVHVSRLRKALGDAQAITTTPAGYRLRVDPDELDAARFEQLVEEGRRALAGGRPERAADLLREALGMWRGPPLADLAFEPFAAAEIARLDEQRLAALEARVEADMAAGRHAELIAELQQLVAANPSRERLAADLMLALYRCGRQTEALEAYQQARRTLVDEIGVEPGHRLRELQEAILRQDTVLDSRVDAPELPPELDSSTAIPLAGRDAELTWLRRRWERAGDGSGALVMLRGDRGSGKTRLAAELAADAHRHGEAVVYAGGRGPPAATLAAIDRIRRASRPTLFVLDDVDAAGPEVLLRLGAAAPALSRLPALVLLCGEDADAVAGLGADGVLTLEPLDEGAVRTIAGHYAAGRDPAEIPVAWLLEASQGVPARVHEVASHWARREAARHVTAVAERAGAERRQLRSIQDELVGGVVELQEARERILARSEDEVSVVCPFKGLASYERADAGYFFGRERLVAELVARLVGAPLLAVVGPSGSGKSSVMRAGLLPALAGGVLPGSGEWAQLLIRPGEHPLRELAAARAGCACEGRLVLAVDQFEETFTVCADEAERAAFVAELVQAAQDPSGRHAVVLALRADCYGRCAAHPELSRLLAANNVLVGSMQHDELRRAVEGPCRRAGLRIEPELVEALVADVELEPGGLPLMSTALLELWKRRDGRLLTRAAYAQTGGVHGAVARLAEDAFGQLGEAQQAVARRILMRLVGAGDGGTIERRRVALLDLDPDHDEDVARIVALLIDRRLLTVDAGTVEVAHEALLREWPRLRRWIEEDRDGLRIQRGLSAAAEEWERLGRDPEALLRGSRLIEAVDWGDAARPALNEVEREFLGASEAARDADRLTRRRRFRLALGAGATIVVATMAVAVAAIYVARERGITAARDRALALATQSAAVLDTDPELGLALAREALKARPTAQAQDALRQAALADRTTAAVQASTGPVWVAAPSPDGHSLASAGNDGSVRIWQLGRLSAGGRLLTRHRSPVFSTAFTPDGKSVASVAYDGEVALTPVGGGQRKVLARLGGQSPEFATSVDAGAGQLVVGTSAGMVRLIPTVAGARPRVLGRYAPTTTVTIVSFDRAHARVVSGGDDGNAYIWRLAGGRPIALRVGVPVFGASFSPDGHRVATAGGDGRVRLWDAASGSEIGAGVQSGDKPLISVRFRSDGQRLVTTSDDGVVRILDPSSGQLLSAIPGGSAQYAVYVGGDAVVSGGTDGTLRMLTPLAVIALPQTGTGPSFSPDGTRVVSGGEDGSVHLWDPAAGELAPAGHKKASTTIFSPDGRQVLSASVDGTVRRYDIATRRSRLLPFPRSPWYAIAVTRAGRIAVGGNENGDAIVVADADGGHRAELAGHTAGINALDFSPDGTHLASASNDGTVRLWNLATGRTERVIKVDPAQVLDVSYSRDGSRLATAGADGTARIWPLRGGAAVVLAGHVGAVSSVRFDRRGDRLVSAGLDGSVRIWGTAGGDALVLLHRHPATGATGADFGRDGRSVVSAGADGIRITPCETCASFADALRVADARAAHPLSASERQRLVDSGR